LSPGVARATRDRERQLAAIRERLKTTTSADLSLRLVLVTAHETLRRSASIGEPERSDVPAAASPRDELRVTYEDYLEMVDRIRGVASTLLPAGARVLVVSRGDDALTSLPGASAQHFPRAATGEWAGYYPANAADAIVHLEDLRGSADFLMLPATAFWWLDYYVDLTRHLFRTAVVVHHDEACIFFDLRRAAPSLLDEGAGD
jgi:hypothetical protein